MKEQIQITMRGNETADEAMHDELVDHDPMFLEWDDVERFRHGRMLQFLRCEEVQLIDSVQVAR